MMKNYALRLEDDLYNDIKKKHKNFSLYIRSLIEKDLRNESKKDCCEDFLKLKEELGRLSKRFN